MLLFPGVSNPLEQNPVGSDTLQNEVQQGISDHVEYVESCGADTPRSQVLQGISDHVVQNPVGSDTIQNKVKQGISDHVEYVHRILWG
jgi:hypothetical protein